MSNISKEVQQVTYAGRVSWAGPASNNPCRECVFWSGRGERISLGRHEYFGKHDLAPRPCVRARQVNHEITVSVPHDAVTRARFEANSEPPPVWAKPTRRDS